MSKTELTTDYQKYIALSRYARWRDDLGRRETWEETVNRYFNHVRKWLADKKIELPSYEFEELWKCYNSVLNLKNMPSMRALMTAGKALERESVAGYNCAFLCVNDIRAFDETCYILLNGTGVGFSVERKYVNCLPDVADEFHNTETSIVVPDSKIGWATSLRELISLLYAGKIPQIDVSKVRPAGARLKTFGGRASGPGPLLELFKFCVDLFKRAAGRKLKDIECHDIICKIASVVVVGGVRRSALISISDLDSVEMRNCKSGNWWEYFGHRALANNSAIYYNKPEMGEFLDEWISLYRSGSGERGIFNKYAVNAMNNGRRDYTSTRGTNPCAEVLLRNGQFCNLTTSILRPEDSKDDIAEKVVIATILGTIQSAWTDFKYLRKIWKNNCEEERLLGVSFTGILDHPIMGLVDSDERDQWLYEFRQLAIKTNERWAKILGIEPSTAISLVKPEGCRPLESVTVTENGILTLSEIKDVYDNYGGGGWFYSNNNIRVNNDDKYETVSKFFDNGQAEVFEISLNYGQKLKSTANHPWFVKENHRDGNYKNISINKFVKTSDLKKGDVLDVNTKSYRKKEPHKFNKLDYNKYEFHNNCSGCEMPDFMDEDLAWFLGYLWGDGCMKSDKSKFSWIDHGKDNLEKIARIAKEKFGISANIAKCNDRNAHTFEFANRVLWAWFLENGLYKYNEDKSIANVPIAVRTSSYEHILSFFAGLIDSDGCVSPKTRNFQWTTANKKFAEHMQSILLPCGINLAISINTKGVNCQQSKKICLCNVGGGCDVDSVNILIKNSTKLAKHPDVQWNASKDGRLIQGKIKSIKSLGVMQTADIEVENSNWYRAGAFKSHNTTSELTNAAPGIHPRFSRYLIRRIRADSKDPLTQMMKDSGFPWEPDITKPESVVIFSFPQKAPDTAVLRDNLSAIDQLKLWLAYKKHWAEHTVSITVYVRSHEWIEVADFVYKHFDDITGISFLPHTDHIYKQAPYQEITKDEYEEMLAKMPKDVDWSRLTEYEKFDTTTSTQEYACTGPEGCMIK